MQIELLKKLLAIQSPSGNEATMSAFLQGYFETASFKNKPRVHAGVDFQDCLAVVFGKPRTAVFVHMDTVGFHVRYGNELVEIGSPEGRAGDVLVGHDGSKPISCTLAMEEDAFFYEHATELPRGTELVYEHFFEETDNAITSPYLDNRIGLWNALSLADNAEDLMLVFTAWEEHKGGAATMMGKFMYEEFGIRQALISDITYATHGIKHGNGAVVSMRDSGIPRRSYINRIIAIAEESKVPFQLEVESYGGSDGNELQKLPYPIDWCFVGAPCSNMHSSREKVFLPDVLAMNQVYTAVVGRL